MLLVLFRALSGVTTPGQSGPGSNGHEGVLRIPQSFSTAGTSPSDCLVSYPGHLLEGGVLPLCRGAVGVFYNPSPLDNAVTGKYLLEYIFVYNFVSPNASLFSLPSCCNFCVHVPVFALNTVKFCVLRYNVNNIKSYFNQYQLIKSWTNAKFRLNLAVINCKMSVHIIIKILFPEFCSPKLEVSVIHESIFNLTRFWYTVKSINSLKKAICLMIYA